MCLRSCGDTEKVPSVTKGKFSNSLPLLILLSALWLANSSLAQQTVITGRVTDAATLEPLAFANVYVKGTQTGTSTNFEGYYEIRTHAPCDSLTASFIGYHPDTKPVIKGEEQVINFQLFPSTTWLKGIVIVPGENPAHPLLRNVWKNKNWVNPDRLEAWEFESYTRTQVYLRRFFDRGGERDTADKGLFNTLAITSHDNAIPALPVYLGENWSTVYYLRFPEREKVVVKASKTNSLADVETAMLTQLIQKSTQYNFHNNHVRILDKSFISPISSSGLFYYRYHLVDSLYIDNRYCYEVKFEPRREEDLVFSGTFWIHDSTFALKRISVEVGRGANLNFVQRIKIQQDLTPSTSGVWYPAKTRILADAVNIFISAAIVNERFTETSPHPPAFYDTELELADTAHHVSDTVWHHLRPHDPDTTDLATDRNISQLKQSTYARLLAGLVNMSVKGYVNLGKVELGPYLLVYRNNEVEGHRFRLGARTTPSLSMHWIARGYLAYGTLDQKVKYNAQLERFLNRRSWTKIGVQYSEDVEYLGAMDEFYQPGAFLSFASSFGGSDKMNRITVGRLWFESDLFRGYTQKIVFRHKTMIPVSPGYHIAWYADVDRSMLRSGIRVSEITFTGFYQPKATFIIDKHERFPVALKKSPAFTLNYTIGIKGLLNSDFSYHMVSLGVKQNLMLGGLGVLTYDVNLSRCFTPLPYPLLIMLPGNESLFRSDRLFNLMQYGEFVADQSATLFVAYRQEGFILDKIPLVKKLKLRSVATVHLAFGSFDEQYNGICDGVENLHGILAPYDYMGNPVTGFKTLDPSKPYAEVSYGIENIGRIFRLDAIHRLTYLSGDANHGRPKRFGIKLSAAFRF